MGTASTRSVGTRPPGASLAAERPAPRARRSPLRRAGDVAARAVAFAYYGLGGLTVAFVAIPAARALDRLRGRREAADLRAQRVAHLASRSFVWLLERMGCIRVEWRGVEALRRGPRLVVANHPSLIDTPLLTACMPQADFVISPAWSRNPFLRRAIRAADYLRADRGPRVVGDAVARLRAGRSVVIYPEGSRTPPEGLRPFHRGAAHIALAAGCDILPVVIRVSPRTLMKGEPWYAAPAFLPRFVVEVGEPIRLADHGLADLAAADVAAADAGRAGRGAGAAGRSGRALAARRLTGILQAHFETRWRGGEC